MLVSFATSSIPEVAIIIQYSWRRRAIWWIETWSYSMVDTWAQAQGRNVFARLLFHDWKYRKSTSRGIFRSHFDQHLQMVENHIQTASFNMKRNALRILIILKQANGRDGIVLEAGCRWKSHIRRMFLIEFVSWMFHPWWKHKWQEVLAWSLWTQCYHEYYSAAQVVAYFR